MTRQWIEKQDTYTGPAQLQIEGQDHDYPVAVLVTGYVTMHEIDTFGGQTLMEGVRSWDAQVLDGLTETDRFKLVGQRMRLALPNGRSGGVALKDTSANYLSGYGEPPFGLEEEGA